MTLHLIKLCVGAASIDDLAAWQRAHRMKVSQLLKRLCVSHGTSQRPKRQTELLQGGSLFWVIKGVVQVRQRLVGFEDGRKSDGSSCCILLLDPDLVPVRPVPRRAFQGWRYLDAADAPPDLQEATVQALIDMPVKMRKELTALCLI